MTMMPRLNNQVTQPLQRAFTLMEILVVIAIIALVMSITLPGIIGLFTAGSDSQARNVISAMLGAARGVAVENQSYAGLHVQLDASGNCWAVVMKYDSDPASPAYRKFIPTTLKYDVGVNKFVTVGGLPPRRMPADMAFGEITSGYVTNDGHYKAYVNTDFEGFTTFNIIFGPDGSLATLVGGKVPQIETNVKLFGGDGATAKQQIWETSGITLNEPGASAITAFHYRTFKAMSDADRLGWLEKNGQFLCINRYTGKLLPTK